jgi:hypothetical protein
MTNKNRNRRKVAIKQPKQNKPKPKPTPFSDAGAIVGSRLGTVLNLPYLKGVGKWLGSGIGQIFGSGDYQVVGAMPSYNVMMNDQIPKFSTTRQTNVICHREYLGDILGTAGFNNTLYPLNPGMSKTFPWLSTIAQCYQQYRFHGIIFEFRPLITDFVTNGAPGVVVMATNYNADSVPYTTKQEMENSEYAVSVKPTRELVHGIECDISQTTIPQLYVRTGQPPVGQDLRLYDIGSFQFATQVNPVQNLGELWVSYCVEFFKPLLPADVGGNVLSAISNRTGVALATPLGSTQSGFFGDLDLTITNGATASWTGQPGNLYVIVLAYSTGAATVTGLTETLVGLTVVNPINTAAPETGVASASKDYTRTYRCTNLVPGVVSYSPIFTGTLPSLVSVFVTSVSSELV